MTDEPRATPAKVLFPPCPKCGKRMDTNEMTWILNGKLYCSEGCCRQAAKDA